MGRKGLLLTVLLGLVVLVASAAGGRPAGDPPGLEKARAAQARHTPALLATNGVVGTALSVDGRGRAAVGVLVKSAAAASIPRNLDGVPVVVLVTGEIVALHHRPGHCGGRPLPPGCGGDGTSGITVNPTSGLVTSEAGASDTFTVVLDTQPGADVTIGIWSDDITEGTVSTTSLTFTSGNWNQSQTVTVTGVDDGNIVDGDISYKIVTDPATSVDPAYDGLPAADVSTTNLDNDGDTTLPDCHATGQTTVKCARDVPLGVSVAHGDVTAGTLGVRAIDDRGTSTPNDDVYYFITNNHVAANSNQASLGDPIYQPGPYDDGGPGDEIGTLAAFVPINWGGSNVVDGSLVETTPAETSGRTPDDGYGRPSSTTDTVRIRERATKYGRTTKQTKCRVWATEATVNVNYGDTDGDGSNNYAVFENQIVFSGGSCSAGGDSGSVFVNQNKRPVGLLFAGSSNSTIANPIAAVLSELEALLPGGANLKIDGT